MIIQIPLYCFHLWRKRKENTSILASPHGIVVSGVQLVPLNTVTSPLCSAELIYPTYGNVLLPDKAISNSPTEIVITPIEPEEVWIHWVAFAANLSTINPLGVGTCMPYKYLRCWKSPHKELILEDH